MLPSRRAVQQYSHRGVSLCFRRRGGRRDDLCVLSFCCSFDFVVVAQDSSLRAKDLVLVELCRRGSARLIRRTRGIDCLSLTATSAAKQRRAPNTGKIFLLSHIS